MKNSVWKIFLALVFVTVTFSGCAPVSEDVLVGQWQFVRLRMGEQILIPPENDPKFIEFFSDGTVSTSLGGSSDSKASYKIDGNHLVIGDPVAAVLCDNPKYAIEDATLTLICYDDMAFDLRKTIIHQP